MQNKRETTQDRFRNFFEDSADALLIMDIQDGRIIDCNRATEELLLGDKNQIIGLTPDQISPPIQPDGTPSFEAVGQRIAVVLEKSKHRFEWMHRRLDSSDFWAEVTISRSVFDGQDVMLVNWRDISELKELQNKLQDYNNDLEIAVLKRTKELEVAIKMVKEANEAKSSFLSNMSHELRTPLNAILGLNQIMSLDKDISETNKEYIEKISQASGHLLSLINDILDLAKVESGQVELKLIPVNLTEIITESVNFINHFAIKNHITIVNNLISDFFVIGDPLRLKQVVLNYLSNAIKYNQKGGQVKINCIKLNNREILFSVTDTGAGIPPENLEKLFVPFNRLGYENSNIEGTGIGLTLTKELVEQMGGKIKVTSGPDQGTTFDTILPLANPKQVILSRDIEKEDDLKSKNKKNIKTDYHVLYIEDNEANYFVIEQALKRRYQNINLKNAKCPEKGFQAINQSQPNLILLDINLPEMNGYEMLLKFKADKNLTNVPVIAISAYARPNDIERGRQAGFDEYLTKPVDINNLYQVIDKFL